MKIKLSPKIPAEDGYFLMQFSQTGGLHLVLIQTDLGGERTMIPDDKNCAIFKLNDSNSKIFKDAYFSQESIIIEKVCNSWGGRP